METEKTTAHLLRFILEAALLQKPYPGQVEGTTFFPDREWVVSQEKIVLIDRNLEGEVELDIASYNIEVLSEAGLDQSLTNDELTILATFTDAFGNMSYAQLEGDGGVNDQAEMDLPEGDWDTVGGLVFDRFGRVPTVGETCVVNGYPFRVERLQGRRITRVSVLQPSATELDPVSESR